MARNSSGIHPLQRKILELLSRDVLDEYEVEVVVSKGQAWIGDEQFSPSSVRSLLRLVALKDVSISEEVERYEISPVGRGLLSGAISRDEVTCAIASGRPFLVGKDGKIEFMDGGSA